MSKRERLTIPLVAMANPLRYGVHPSQSVTNGLIGWANLKLGEGVVEIYKVPRIPFIIIGVTFTSIPRIVITWERALVHINIKLLNYVEVVG